MVYRIVPHVLLGLTISMFLFNGCESWNLERKLIIKTISASEITANSCKLTGEIIDFPTESTTQHGFCYSKTSNPTTTSHNPTNPTAVSFLGSINKQGMFWDVLSGLQPSTRYYAKAYASDDYGTVYGDEVEFTTPAETVIDYDGNEYATVQIGDQVWMAENLKVTHFANGVKIPLVEDSIDWVAQGYGGKAYCWYDNNVANGHTYGAMYSWFAAVNGTTGSNTNPSGIQGVCPDGWHLPSDSEWKELEMYLGMSQSEADRKDDFRGTNEGGKLKETGTSHWLEPNVGATNESGFSALPGGFRSILYDPQFNALGWTADFWTSSFDEEWGWPIERMLVSSYESIWRGRWDENAGNSIRCVKD